MHGKTVPALLFALSLMWLGGCSETQPAPAVRSCRDVQPPSWINDSLVGVSRVTASGNRNDQRKIALQRAIADLLITKGTVTGSSIISLEKNLSVVNKDETLRKHFEENSVMNVTYERTSYDIKVTNIWRDPCTKELYVKIEEK